MPSDSFTEVTNVSWFKRIKNAFAGIIFGVIFFFGSFILLWWNEGRAVTTAKSLKEGAASVVSVLSETVDAGNEGKLVHVTGNATTTETLADPQFNISENAIHLSRSVDMYQWVEDETTKTEKQLGGGEKRVTKYSYEKKWESSVVDSSSFKKRGGHENPGNMPFSSSKWTAKDITLGAFKLTSGQANRIGGSDKISVTNDHYAALSPQLREMIALQDGKFYIARGNATVSPTTEPSETNESEEAPDGDGDEESEPPIAVPDAPIASGSPEIGDVRIAFSVVRPKDVSIIAQQIGSTFGPYQTKVGRPLDMLSVGVKSSESMFEAAERSNLILTWALRAGGCFAMFLGICIFFAPLRVLADVIPILGSILGAGIGLIALAIAVPLSLLTIGAAWIFYRPVLGIILFILALGVFVAVFMLIRSKMAKTTK